MYTLEFSLWVETESNIEMIVLWYHLSVIYKDDFFSLQNIEILRGLPTEDLINNSSEKSYIEKWEELLKFTQLVAHNQ